MRSVLFQQVTTRQQWTDAKAWQTQDINNTNDSQKVLPYFSDRFKRCSKKLDITWIPPGDSLHAIHDLYLWFPLLLHDGGSSHRHNDGPDVTVSSVGRGPLWLNLRLSLALTICGSSALLFVSSECVFWIDCFSVMKHCISYEAIMRAKQFLCFSSNIPQGENLIPRQLSVLRQWFNYCCFIFWMVQWLVEALCLAIDWLCSSLCLLLVLQLSWWGRESCFYLNCFLDILTVNVLCIFPTVQWVGMQSVIVVFPDHAHLLILLFVTH